MSCLSQLCERAHNISKSISVQNMYCKEFNINIVTSCILDTVQSTISNITKYW